jgi:nitrate reductase molybdenum cofactor assembly chaperone NarJ/NarW
MPLLKRRTGRTATRVTPPYHVLSILLRYPDAAIEGARGEVAQLVENLPASPHKDRIARFCAYWSNTPATTLAATYVETFDLQKRCGLYLSYYLYGDTRKRGMALLRLKRLYRTAGLLLEDGELPDYLPAMLEFAGRAPQGYGAIVLGEYRTALALLRCRLQEMGSPYAGLLEVLCQGLAGLSAADQTLLQRLLAEGPPVEQVGLEPYGPPEAMPAREAGR